MNDKPCLLLALPKGEGWPALRSAFLTTIVLLTAVVDEGGGGILRQPNVDTMVQHCIPTVHFSSLLIFQQSNNPIIQQSGNRHSTTPTLRSLNHASVLPTTEVSVHAKAAMSETSFHVPPGCPPRCARCGLAQCVGRSLVQGRSLSSSSCKKVRISG